MTIQGSCGSSSLMSRPPALSFSTCPLLGSGSSLSRASRHVLAASCTRRTGLRRHRCMASQNSENPADSLRAGFSQLWSNISRSARNSFDSLRGGQLGRQAPGPPQPQQAPDAAQESAPQAANQHTEEDAVSTSDAEEEHEREAYALSEGGVDEEMENISFTIEELPEGVAASEYMPGAFQGVDMDAVDSADALQLTVPALPDLAVLADNRAPMSWEDWYQHVFMHKDRAAHRMEQLQSALENAVTAEMYEDATEYSADLARHAQWDDVSKILDEYTEAIQKEDFSRAAALRDEGGAGLVGWWVANPASEDPQGHLLRIQPSFGRYLGMTFSARDVAASQGMAVMVQSGGPQGGLAAGPMAQGMEIVEEGEEVSITSEGTPCMEVWVQRNDDGTFNRQTTLLRPPLAVMAEEESQSTQDLAIVTVANSSDESISATEAKSGDDPQPSGSEINTDTMAEARQVYGAPETPQADGQASTSEEETDSKDDSEASSNASSSSEIIQPGESVLSNEATGIKGKLPARPRRQRRRSRPPIEKEEPPKVFEDQFGNTWKHDEGNSWVLADADEEHTPTPDLHEGLRFGGSPLQSIMNLIRHPATLTSLGRHQLVIQADEKLTAQERRMADATRTLAGQLAAGQKVPLHLTIHNPNSSEVETMDFSGNSAPEGKDPIEQMTEQVMKAMQRHAQGQDPPPEMATKETLTDIIRTATLEFLNQASNSTLGSNGQMTYTRLNLSAASTDPFCGTFLGSFGGNGLELLQITRSVDKDGDECVVATKLTGDPNVPAGQVSFKAKITRSNKLSTRDQYPPELGVLGRYRGTGRIAKSGNKDARWVDGELLRFASNNPATHGAELGFVWMVPQDKRYLVLLNKVELDDPMQDDEDEV